MMNNRRSITTKRCKLIVSWAAAWYIYRRGR